MRHYFFRTLIHALSFSMFSFAGKCFLIALRSTFLTLFSRQTCTVFGTVLMVSVAGGTNAKYNVTNPTFKTNPNYVDGHGECPEITQHTGCMKELTAGES